jgi:hypothetical protein
VTAGAEPRVCVVGAANIDLISYVPRLPRLGETLHALRRQGANQAVMAAKLGARVAMVTKLGRDVFGEGTMANFRECGVETEHVLFTEDAFGPSASHSAARSSSAGSITAASSPRRARALLGVAGSRARQRSGVRARGFARGARRFARAKIFGANAISFYGRS